MSRFNWRVFVASLLALAAAVSAPLVADDEQACLQADADYLFNEPAVDGSADAFASALSSLQSRIESLEEQNARLESQLAGQEEFCSLNSDEEKAKEDGEKKEDSDDEEDNPKSFEELLKFSTETEERLKKLEDGIEKDKEAAKKKKEEDAKKAKKWFEKYTIRGYAQFRINDVLENDGPAPAHYVGDGSIGNNQSFLIRRARLIFQGDVSDHLSLYFQPDFASTPPGSTDGNQFAQIRDLYADIYLDDEKELRFRVGQSKVPYGWENLQSSSNRLPLDRNDALNSAVRNERDLGVFMYWTPKDVQEIFDYINENNLKGSGNYGLAGFGVHNGQGGSFREQNDNLHTVARVTLPFWLNDCQIVEVGMQGYTGKYAVLSSGIAPPPANTGTGTGIRDERLAWTFVYYPMPIGFQSEWTVGRGPSLNAARTSVDESHLYGGYAMMMYRQKLEKGELIPFARWNYYEGGYKSERNAPRAHIEEWEFGTEWQFSKSLELVTMYTMTNRTNTSAIPYEQFEGDLLRFQVQVNY